MKCTISATEPHILREAKRGDLFVLHDPYWHECVCTVFNDFRPLPAPDFIRVICIACRVDEGEFGWHQSGETLTAHSCAAITLVEQVEPLAFRERTSGQTDAQREALRLVDVLAGRESVVVETKKTFSVDPAKQSSELLAYTRAISLNPVRSSDSFSELTAEIHIPVHMRTTERIAKFISDVVYLVNTSFCAQPENKTSAPANGAAL